MLYWSRGEPSAASGTGKYRGTETVGGDGRGGGGANIFALTVIALLSRFGGKPFFVFLGSGGARGGVGGRRGRCANYARYCLPAFGDIEANLGVTTSSAATLSFVVPPFVFQFVQQALFIQF